MQYSNYVTCRLSIGITQTFFSDFQILIGSIMCGYSKEDWIELAKMAEVRLGCVSCLFSGDDIHNDSINVYCYARLP